MEMGKLRGLFMLTVTLTLAAFWTTVAICRLLFFIVTNPRAAFRKKERKQCPTILTEGWNHSYITVKGIKLHYVFAGAKEKPLMLLVHGFPEFWFSWRHQIKEFSKNYRVVAVDMRGYGDSGKPKRIANYTISALKNDLKDLIEALGYEKCTLVAHDWGAVIGWQLMMAHPQVVEKAVIIDCPHPKAFKRYLYGQFKQLLKSWYMFFFQCPVVPEFALGMNDFAMFDEMLKFEDNPEVVEAYKYNYGRPGAYTPPLNYYRAAFLRSSPVLTDSVSPFIKIPILILWGSEDVALSPELANESAKFCLNSNVQILNGNHFIHQERPAEVNKLIQQFVTA